jgi:Arc/MetJ-type ribon-helix-helix transcriptional regulator
MTARPGSSAISGRIPNALYRWLEAKVKNGEYPNLNQALTAQLLRAKTLEEERETHKDLLKMRADIVREVVQELEERARQT